MKSSLLTSMGLLLTLKVHALSGLPIENNGNVELSLSQTNYNRIVVQGDKIFDMYFPDGTMLVRKDGIDGGIYVMPVTQAPVTLFLTTEAGRHLSVTVSGEQSLGKTFALLPKGGDLKREALIAPVKPEENKLVLLINHMMSHKSLEGFKVVPLAPKVERMGKGLVLTPKEAWQGADFSGDVTQIYNNSSEPQNLSYQAFQSAGIDALKLSKIKLAPGESAFLYRVKGEAHA